MLSCYLCDFVQSASALWPRDSSKGSTDGLHPILLWGVNDHHEVPFLLSVTEGGFLSWGFPGGSYSKESACSSGDIGFNPWVGKIAWRGNGNPFQCSCLGTPMNRGAWRHKESDMTERLTQPMKGSSFYRTRPPPPFLLSFFYFLSSSNIYWSLLRMRHCLELGIQYREEQDNATSALLKLIVDRERHL